MHEHGRNEYVYGGVITPVEALLNKGLLTLLQILLHRGGHHTLAIWLGALVNARHIYLTKPPRHPVVAKIR